MPACWVLLVLEQCAVVKVQEGLRRYARDPFRLLINCWMLNAQRFLSCNMESNISDISGNIR